MPNAMTDIAQLLLIHRCPLVESLAILKSSWEDIVVQYNILNPDI